MKRFLCGLLLLLPVCLLAQKQGDNTVTVAGIDADRVVTLLLDSGYRLEAMADEFSKLRTQYRSIGPEGLEMALFVEVKGDQAFIRGKWRKGSIAGDVVFVKTKPSQQLEAFQQMQHFAMGFKKGVKYSKS